MIVSCTKCGDRFNDETVSTVCPHRGIGYCRACDCVVCVCSVLTTNRKSNRYQEPAQLTEEGFLAAMKPRHENCDCPLCQIDKRAIHSAHQMLFGAKQAAL